MHQETRLQRLRVTAMGIRIKPSDLYYRYRKNKEQRNGSAFTGKPDSHPYDRDDLYEVIPMLEAVMDELDRRDADVLHRLEELAGDEMPKFIRSREEVFDFLVNVMRDALAFEPGKLGAGPRGVEGEADPEG
jgi:hypothetical protein